jgi:hypothetical protein
VRRISAAFRGLGSTTFVALAQRMKPFATGDTIVAIQRLVRVQDELGLRFDAFARHALTRLFQAFTVG